MLAKCYQYIQNIQNNQYQEYFSISTIRDILVISASVAVIYAVVNQNVSANESKENLNTEASVAAGANVIRSYDYKKFNWAFYQSPANPVFFDEGEGHIPPRPYIYLAQNPTLENAIKLQEWQRKKMEVTNQVTQLLLEASKPIDMKKLTSLDPVSFNNYLTSKKSTNKNVISEKNDEIFSVNESDFKNVSILYFYRSDCLHCKNTKSTIEKLISMGVRIIPVQLDYKTNLPEFKNSMPYDSQIATVFPVTETPTFVFKMNNESRSLKGALSLQEISKVISLIKNNKG